MGSPAGGNNSVENARMGVRGRLATATFNASSLRDHEGQHAATLGSGVYARRATGRDRHHRHDDGATASGSAAGTGILAALELLEQHTPTGVGFPAIRNPHASLPAGNRSIAGSTARLFRHRKIYDMGRRFARRYGSAGNLRRVRAWPCAVTVVLPRNVFMPERRL